MSALNAAEAVIFDMDGVLTDSEWFIAEAARLMFKETHGVTVTHGDFLPFVGLGENRFLGGVAEKHGVAGFDIDRDKARTYEIYGDLVKGKLKPLPGAVEFVRQCRALGCKTALATSTDYIKMMASLTEIGLIKQPPSAAEVGLAVAIAAAAANNAFDALVNGLDVERRKPFPDIFLEAARRVGAAPEHCWVVEDSVGGIAAAKAAGMRCLALLTTFPETEIRAAGADIVARDLSSISPEALLNFPPENT
ncbi:MAG: HAD-IA family hydrolase [Treponema sp.]|jgi:beta-phosphoglucomutase-like phosphatase (HAD superfamily)|nr:HAD-IA family hydrolase [Treponema sp.]